MKWRDPKIVGSNPTGPATPAVPTEFRAALGEREPPEMKYMDWEMYPGRFIKSPEEDPFSKR